MLPFVGQYFKEVIALTTPFIAWFLTTRLNNRVSLLQDLKHSFSYLIREKVPGPDNTAVDRTTLVHTQSISVFNNGRAPATKVEVVFNFQPQYCNIWPARHHDIKLAPDGRCSFLFDNLAPKEVIGFELLSFRHDLPEIITTRSEQGAAKRRVLTPWPIPPLWKIRLFQFFAAFGISSLIYILVIGVEYLAKPTP